MVDATDPKYRLGIEIERAKKLVNDPGVQPYRLPENRTGYPDDNPKTAVGVKKIPLHLVPPASIHGEAEALADGAEKYGPYNWREFDISASTYIAATLRHIHAWWDGEDAAHDSLVHHIKHAKATLGIMLDAMTIGKLKDDRPPAGACPDMQRAYARQKALDEMVAESQQLGLYDQPYGGTD